MTTASRRLWRYRTPASAPRSGIYYVQISLAVRSTFDRPGRTSSTGRMNSAAKSRPTPRRRLSSPGNPGVTEGRSARLGALDCRCPTEVTYLRRYRNGVWCRLARTRRFPPGTPLATSSAKPRTLALLGAYDSGGLHAGRTDVAVLCDGRQRLQPWRHEQPGHHQCASEDFRLRVTRPTRTTTVVTALTGRQPRLAHDATFGV